MRLIVYIHGFNGSVESPKVAALRAAFPNAVVEAPDYPDNDALPSKQYLSDYLKERIQQYDDIVLTGCSLGGFWAHYMGNIFGLPALLMNPAAKPWDSLQKYVGDKLTDAQAAAFKKLDVPLAQPETVFNPRVVLLEEGDQVIDPYENERIYKGHAYVELLPGGSHRFDNYSAMNGAVEDLFTTIVYN